MSKPIKLSGELVNEAIAHGKAKHRSPPKQIEYWVRIGKIADENLDLPNGFVKDIISQCSNGVIVMESDPITRPHYYDPKSQSLGISQVTNRSYIAAD